MKNKNNIYNPKTRGFTLLEVLVAGFILFLVISTMTLIYRGAILSSTKAEEAVLVSQSLPFILELVRSEIRANKTEQTTLESSSEILNVSFRWQAQLTDHQPPPPRFDVDQDQFTNYPKRFKLWHVNLVLLSKGYSKNYQFKEVSW